MLNNLGPRFTSNSSVFLCILIPDLEQNLLHTKLTSKDAKLLDGMMIFR